jgi:hypothetical protein
MTSRDRFLSALKRALEFVDCWAAPARGSPVEELASPCLVRLRSQLRAVLALARAPGVDGTELEVLARPLLEAGITAGWVGRDATRAQVFHDKGAVEVEKSMRRFVNAVNGCPGTKVQGRTVEFPSLEERAREAGRWYAGAYDVSYPRLSAATHGFDAAFRTVQPGEIAASNALEDAVSWGARDTRVGRGCPEAASGRHLGRFGAGSVRIA